jgi:hypothetical protein
MARLQLQSATRGGQGIVEPGDLRVTATEVPGSNVQAAAGGVVVRGAEAAFQGSYYGHNVGIDTVSVNPTGSGGGRTDMVVARVEDPTVDGTPWTHPVDGQLIFTRVIENVSADATEPPAGMSAIPLARITLPANTATITQDMITDLRQMIDPRQLPMKRVQRGVTPYELLGNVTTYYENAPNLVWSQVPIPEWATQVQMIGHWMNMWQSSDDLASGSGSTDARGRARIALGYGAGGGPTDIVTESIAYNFNLNTSNGERRSFGLADQQPIPAEMRGQLANLRMQVQGTADIRGRLRCDEWSNFYVDLMFLEVPVADVD